ncbi:hypothetical protein B7P43_G10364 [Cryptotermes secundus]|uniref:Nose resistant-to-fluoxetine protein N-terminal domain-containing protein n=1 Tax=Cryptotermes secundus TaxID=105785 RepID=A0A2J7PZG4_9NEOP|nr:nose resistant to fluoxetine protein 6 [Cryptotermes secundus]PNF21731.1 hypothetical protein B7P43_G10364 [Cryptotermes secundus]PNF21732.1 hypothetical protein B7P43_G10364 [Cryptotermes secundus]
MRRFVYSFHPYRITACYAIFLIVRAEETAKNFVEPTSLEEPIQELLGNLLSNGDEVPLRNQFSCDGTCESVVLQRSSANEFSHQSFQRKTELSVPSETRDRGNLNDEPWASQQQTCTSTPVLAKTRPSNRTKNTSFQRILNILPVLAPTSDQIRNEVCREHSRIFVRELKRHKLWALQMYDASAKLPSGILRGNVNQLGDFDQCLNVTSQNEPRIDGKYCLASVDVESTNLNTNEIESLQQAVQLSQAYAFIKSSYRDPGHFIPRFTTITWAVCVPASCSPSDVHQALEEALHGYNETTGLIFDVHVDPDMCYVKHETGKPLETATILTLVFFIAVVSVATVATFRDARRVAQHQKEEGPLERAVMAFSVHKNMRELLAELPAEGDINCIYGVRALCTMTVYLTHKVIAVAFSPYSNRVELTEVSNEGWATMLRTSLVFTDSFLLMSGVLTSFNMSKEMQRKKHIDWIKKYVARFIRLTPALLAVVLFYAYVLEHLGAGPQWNLAVKRNADFCKESFWRNILYIQNFFPFEQMCATHTHQLALDMQLSLLSPLLVTLLWHWPACGVLLLLCLHALSTLLRYVATYRNQLSLAIFHGITVKQLYQTANLTYTRSLHRATPYLLGVSLGYLLHRTDRNTQIPKMIVWAGWLLATYFVYLCSFSHSDLRLRDYRYSVNDASNYAAYSPIISSLALSWLIWACFTGHGGLLNELLSSKCLVIFSRISYSVYLTQFAVFFYNVGSIRTSEKFSIFASLNMAEILTVLVVSTLVTLLFDLPMQEIKSILMGDGPRRGKAH